MLLQNWIWSFMGGRVKEFTVCFLAVDWSLGNNDRKTSGLVRHTVHSTYICTGGHWHSPDSEVLLQANPRGVMWTWLRFVSVSLLVTVYSFSLYLTGVNCERFTTCISCRSLDMWLSIWELWAFLFLSPSIPSPSTRPVSVCLRIVSVSLLVIFYSFSL